MAKHMSAREAWEIVQLGQRWLSDKLNDEHREARHEKWRRDYARACAIVEARIAWCEAMDAHFDAPHGQGMKTWIAAQDVLDKARALERGEEGK